MTLTLRQLLVKALAQFDAAASVTNDELEDARLSLNLMLATWATPPHNLIVQALTHATHTLTAGTATYTIGASGADWTTARPREIMNAFIRDSSSFDHPMRKASILEYQGITDKSRTGRPEEWAYEPHAATLGRIYLHPTPDAAETLCIDYLAPFSEITGMGTDISLSDEILNAIRWNLAVELAPEYTANLSPVVLQRAQDTLAAITNGTAANRARPIAPEISSARSATLADFFAGGD